MRETKLFVGNLEYAVTEGQLEALFAAYGEVRSVTIIAGRGFGFVEMESESATAAISALDGTEFEGRNLRVNVAREKTRRPRRDRNRRF